MLFMFGGLWLLGVLIGCALIGAKVIPDYTPNGHSAVFVFMWPVVAAIAILYTPFWLAYRFGRLFVSK